MASKILKMGSRVIFWVGEPPQKFFSKSEGVGEIMLFYFNFDLLEEFSDQDRNSKYMYVYMLSHIKSSGIPYTIQKLVDEMTHSFIFFEPFYLLC